MTTNDTGRPPSARLNILAGHVIERCQSRPTHTEFIAFLNTIDRQTPRRQDLHLILDHYGTHTHPTVKTWLTRAPAGSFPFHTDRGVLAEPRRALLRRDYAQ